LAVVEIPWNNGAISYILKTGVSASNSSVWNLTRPLVITFVLACGLVEAGPALAFVALLLTEAALQETGKPRNYEISLLQFREQLHAIPLNIRIAKKYF
jgi:hypothetical protein